MRQSTIWPQPDTSAQQAWSPDHARRNKGLRRPERPSSSEALRTFAYATKFSHVQAHTIRGDHRRRDISAGVRSRQLVSLRVGTWT